MYHLNPPKQELIGYHESVSMMTELLKKSWDRIGRDVMKLPDAIMVYRDGVADGQLREMNSKEVTGIRRAIHQFFNKTIKNVMKKAKAENGCRPKYKGPKTCFVVCQSNIMDVFGQVSQGHNGERRVDQPRDALVIFDYVMSHRMWDFLGWFNPRGKNRPVRYIVVYDGPSFGDSQASAQDMFQFTYGLTYTYANSIPFPLGNVNQPA